MPTFEKISSTIITTNTITITLSSIPGTYTDLVLKLSGRNVNGGNIVDVVNATFNSTSPSTNGRGFEGGGNSTSSFTSSRLGVNVGPNATSNVFNNLELYIANYTSSTTKSFWCDSITENNSTNAYQNIWNGTIPLNSAITTIALTANTFAPYTTVALYGILNT
jgi:hypothetical protein